MLGHSGIGDKDFWIPRLTTGLSAQSGRVAHQITKAVTEMSGYCWTLSAEIGTFFATIMKGKNIRRLEKSESSTHGILRRNKSGEADFISLMMIPPDLFAKLFY